MKRHSVEFTVYGVEPEDVLSVFIKIEDFLAMLPYLVDYGVKDGKLAASFKFRRSIFIHEDECVVKLARMDSTVEIAFKCGKGQLRIVTEASKIPEGTKVRLTVEYSGKNEWVVSVCLDEMALIAKDYIVEMSGSKMPILMEMVDKLPKDDVVKDVFKSASLILRSNLIGSIESDKTDTIYNFVNKLRPFMKKSTYISINQKNSEEAEFASRLLMEDGIIVGAYVKYQDKQLTGPKAVELLKKIRENATINLWEVR